MDYSDFDQFLESTSDTQMSCADSISKMKKSTDVKTIETIIDNNKEDIQFKNFINYVIMELKIEIENMKYNNDRENLIIGSFLMINLICSIIALVIIFNNGYEETTMRKIYIFFTFIYYGGCLLTTTILTACFVSKRRIVQINIPLYKLVIMKKFERYNLGYVLNRRLIVSSIVISLLLCIFNITFGVFSDDGMTTHTKYYIAKHIALLYLDVINIFNNCFVFLFFITKSQKLVV